MMISAEIVLRNINVSNQAASVGEFATKKGI
jgi:hypothetical protein